MGALTHEENLTLNIRPLFGAAMVLSLSMGLAGSAFAQDGGPGKPKDAEKGQKAGDKVETAPAVAAQQDKKDDASTQAAQQAADYAKAIKDLPKSEGQFTFYQRKKDLLLELPSEELNKTFLIQATMETGITSIVLQAGDPIGGNEIDAYH